tara:strand:- start:5164 stop:5610 length:447 start_codon:yes stop_codon:yes gene_type:complete
MEDKKLTFGEIVAALQEKYTGDPNEYEDNSIRDFAESGFDYVRIPDTYEPIVEVIGDWQSNRDKRSARRTKYLNENTILGGCVEVDGNGGSDRGSDWWRVYHFTKHDVYLKIRGYYTSYEGVSLEDGWDSCSEVVPKQVMVTIYEDKK